MSDSPAVVLYDAAGNPVTITNDAGIYRVNVVGKVTITGASPPPATNPAVIYASTPLVVGTHDTTFVIPNGQTFHLQEIVAGNADSPKGASVEVIYNNGVMHLVERVYTSGATITVGYPDRSAARDGTPMVGNGSHTIIVRRAKFSGTNLAIDAVVRGYTV